MANNCYFEMKIKGENRDRLHAILDYKDDEYILARVFSVDVVDDTGDTLFLCGDCAWSVYSCMCGEGNGSYYKPDEEERDSEGRLLVNMAFLTKELNLEVEIISDEPGMRFSEHYYYKNGEAIIDDCVEYPSDVEVYNEATDEFYCGIDKLVSFNYL